MKDIDLRLVRIRRFPFNALRLGDNTHSRFLCKSDELRLFLGRQQNLSTDFVEARILARNEPSRCVVRD